MRTLFIFLFFLFTSVVGHTQHVKKLTGTSVWTKNGKVYADSIAYIITYDRQGHKTSEWQQYRDTSGMVTYSNYAEYDTMARVLYYQSGVVQLYYTYTEEGAKIKTIMILNGDTTTSYHIPLGSQGQILGRHYTPYQFTRKGNKTIETQGDKYTYPFSYSTQTTTYDKFNHITHIGTISFYNKKRSVETATFKRDKDGRVLSYTKEVMGALVKRTTHFYQNGVEQSQTEEFFKPDYIITTSFAAEFWD